MKRKIILYISQSLDGFIADDNRSVDWILGNDEEYVSDYGYENFIKDIDTVILGATTYKQIKMNYHQTSGYMKICKVMF